MSELNTKQMVCGVGCCCGNYGDVVEVKEHSEHFYLVQHKDGSYRELPKFIFTEIGEKHE